MVLLPRLIAALALAAAFQPGVGRADTPNPSFYLVNHASQPIKEVYASPVSAEGWGRDRLADGAISAGGNGAIRLLADGSCVFDLRVVYGDGHTEERRRVNTCGVDDITFGDPGTSQSPPPPNPAHDPSFRIVNRGHREIDEVYARLTGSNNWGRDRLGDATIDGQSYRVIRLPSGQCMWDVKVVFEAGPPLQRRGLNLCNVTDFPID